MRTLQISVLLPLLVTWLCLALPATVRAEPDQQQAAAEAYDRGSTAYSAGNFAEAAKWFETAYRYAPAAEALIVAARSYSQAGDHMRAATLALVLREMYPSHADAEAVASELLDAYQGEFLRVKVVCNQCALEVDGQLQAEYEFFVAPDETHDVTASNGVTEQTKQVSGQAGKDVLVMFSIAAPSTEPVAPPPPEPEPKPVVQLDTSSGKPFSPLFIYVAAGVTGALLIGTVVETAHTLGGVSTYEDAAKRYRECVSDCASLESKARALADKGHTNETITTVLWSATAVVGVATITAALWLTDWDDDKPSASKGLQFAVTPGLDLRSGSFSVRGEF